MKLTNSQLLETKKYTDKEIKNAALIIHPGKKGYNITVEEIFIVFEEGSNFTQLGTPIYDDFENEFWDSEGYYMAARTDNLEVKKMIAFMSIGHGLSRKTRGLYELDQDLIRRIDYMRKAIQKKFDNNPDLKKNLIDTGDSEIIEYTYWKDILFGIDQETLEGCNVLGKLLMEYRDSSKNG